MDAIARRVVAERARRRLPLRLRRRRAAVRVAGVLATVGLLGAGAAAALMVVPDDEPASAPAAAATPTPAPVARRPAGPTRAQRAQRRAALAKLRRAGAVPVRRGDYDVRDTLRVLIGRPAAAREGPRRAFFFVGRRLVGHDAPSPSARLRVASSRKRTVTLAYRTYAPPDAACCPTGARVRVRFRWSGGRLRALDPVPAAWTRLAG
jgi:hypothetical protein